MLANAAFYGAFQNLFVGGNSDTVAKLLYPELSVDSKVLDIGCGPATFLEAHGSRVSPRNYTGIDPSRRYISAASRRFPDSKFLAGTVATVSEHLKDSRFDLITAGGVLHHVDDDEARNIIEFAVGHLAPRGSFVTIDPVWLDGQKLITRILLELDRGRHIRRAESYQALFLKSAQLTPEHRVFSGLSRVPYNHITFRVRVGDVS